MIPFISYEDAIKKQERKGVIRLLSQENGCKNGCCSGISLYTNTEFNPNAGAHNDQEGFFVLEGEGEVMLGEQIFNVKQGDSFVALAGVKHTLRTYDENIPLKVFWFHSAI